MMTWFRNFFAKTLRQHDDPSFGVMTYEDGGWAALPGSSCDYMVIVDARIDGPTDTQCDLFLQIKARTEVLLRNARVFVERQAVGMQAPSGSSVLTIYAVVIGDDVESARSQFTLELSDTDAHVIHCVQICDWAPSSYWIED